MVGAQSGGEILRWISHTRGNPIYQHRTLLQITFLLVIRIGLSSGWRRAFKSAIARLFTLKQPPFGTAFARSRALQTFFGGSGYGRKSLSKVFTWFRE